MRALQKPVETSPQRMAPLSKLPVFLDLTDKRAVVVGGTAAAAWKAELLAAAGARVEIHAVTLGSEMAALIERGASPGTLTHSTQGWTEANLAGAAIAIADAADDTEAAAFHAAALLAGVPVNVIDRPAFCQFQFGSIVNRSPVVIGISTDGAAPILGQAIRRRIETLLPPALAGWAALAKKVRAPMMARLARGPARRTFWELFAERAFAAPLDGRAKADVDDLIASIASGATTPAGRVTLVGAGPGDAELLTLKAVRALQSADVILFDDLVADEVLELARREAARMLVGKRGGRDSCSQADINALILKLAGQGKHVVRLKSGDPMIFGRGGEEIAMLAAHGIRVDVVPGITSAIALASALGVSLTHRDHAHSLRLLTGHSRNGELPHDLDWRGLADPATTLVVYMGGRTAPAIAARLIGEGLAMATPVVVAAGLSRPEERRWHGTLGELAAGAGQIGSQIGGGLPVLIGIGAAFAAARPAEQADEVPAAAQGQA